MKKLMVKGCIFLLILVLPLIYLNQRYKNSNYFLQLNGLGKYRSIPQNIELLNLGNSHEEAGILYKDNIDILGYNLALASQPFEYDYYVLDYYSSYLKDGATIIIPISYFDWNYNYEKLFMSDISVYNERYYSILDKEHIMNYELKKDILYNRFPLLTAGKNMKYIFEDVEWSKNSVNTNIVEDVEKVASWKYESWVNDVMLLDDENSSKIKKKNIDYLKKTIDYCYEKGYTPVLVSLPVTSNLTDKFSEQFKDEFKETTKNILKSYPELKYFDYSTDSKFSNNLSYFSDADHLNTNGANAFSKQLFQDLKEAKIIQ